MGSSRDLVGFFTLFVVGVQLVWGQLVLDIGSTLSMNGIYYYLPSKPYSHGYNSVYATSASGSKSSRLGLVPITVVNSDAATSNLAALENTLNAFSKQDDVWGDGFLSGELSKLAITLLYSALYQRVMVKQADLTLDYHSYHSPRWIVSPGVRWFNSQCPEPQYNPGYHPGFDKHPSRAILHFSNRGPLPAVSALPGHRGSFYTTNWTFRRSNSNIRCSPSHSAWDQLPRSGRPLTAVLHQDCSSATRRCTDRHQRHLRHYRPPN